MAKGCNVSHKLWGKNTPAQESQLPMPVSINPAHGCVIDHQPHKREVLFVKEKEQA
jgi:hypothetical protein